MTDPYTPEALEKGARAVKATVEAAPGHVSDRLADRIARAVLDAVAGDVAVRALRDVANAVGDGAASSDFMDDHVSDAGIAWFAAEIREHAEEIDGRHTHTWKADSDGLTCIRCEAKAPAHRAARLREGGDGRG
jgi:hypothetical protein